MYSQINGVIMPSMQKSSLVLLELDYTISQLSKPLKGSLVRSLSPSLIQKKRLRRTDYFKQIDVEGLETLISVRSKTPTVLDKTPRLRRANRSLKAGVRVKREPSLKALPIRRYDYAKRHQRNPILTYDPVREVHYYISPYTDSPSKPASTLQPHKPFSRPIRKITRRSSPINRINNRTDDQQLPGMSLVDLQPNVSRSRFSKLL
jgi:hypothetical protein